MTDERYLYRTDVNEKKRTARGIHNKRTHNGKGGCKLPSDYLMRKERDAMNGSVIQYNLNKPMTLVELKKLPSDIQKEYLHTLIYDKGCKRDDLIEMLRTSNSTLHRVQKALGVGFPADYKQRHTDPIVVQRQAEFRRWANLDPAEELTCVPETECAPQMTANQTQCISQPEHSRQAQCLPMAGQMTFDGSVDAIAAEIVRMLGDRRLTLTVFWKEPA